MKRLALALLLLASPVSAQFIRVTLPAGPLPECNFGRLGWGYQVADAIAEDSCEAENFGATGNDRKMALCVCAWTAGSSAFEWQAVSRGASGGGGGSEFEDSAFRVLNDGDNTKELAFDVSGVTTETTRTLTVPNANGTLVIGSTGSTTRAMLTANGTGGSTLQASPNITQDASNNLILGDSTGARELWFSSVSTAPLLRRNSTALRLIGNTGSEVAMQAGTFAAQDNSGISGFYDIQVQNGKKICFSDGVDFEQCLGAGTGKSIRINDSLQLTPLASSTTCDGATEGKLYADTSHALCFCDGTSWVNLTPLSGGSCS